MDIAMNNERQLANAELQKSKRAQKFALWLGMIGMFMMFAALSSGFIVYTASGVDKGIKTLLPSAFVYSTIVIVVSSISMHLGYIAARHRNFSKQRWLLLVTLLLVFLFFICQFSAWSALVSKGIFFINPNASQSFLYIFTGLHLAHILAGIFVIIRCLTGSFKAIDSDKNIFRTEIAMIFWHFLGLLWIYIYVFLLLNQ